MKKKDKFTDQEFEAFFKKEIIDAGIRFMIVPFKGKEEYMFTYISPVNYNREVYNRIIYEKLKNPAWNGRKVIKTALKHFGLEAGLLAKC